MTAPNNKPDTLDTTNAEWHSVSDEKNSLRWAFIRHTDGQTYVAARTSDEPNALTLIFNRGEWEAMIDGMKNGEFN